MQDVTETDGGNTNALAMNRVAAYPVYGRLYKVNTAVPLGKVDRED
jgi:hypothetical protein